MKNRIWRILLIMCISASVFVFTACGGSDSSDTESQEESVEEEETEEEEIQETEVPSEEEPAEEESLDSLPSGKFATIEEMLNSDLMKDTLETQFASLEGSGLSVSLAADGNKMIYNFTIEDPELSAIMDVAALESSLDSQTSTFESLASSLKAAVEVENPVIVVRYLDSSGNELVSREFAG